MNKNSGFTLIELMVTIAVISIIVAIAAPNMQTWIENERFRSTASDIQSALQMAKMAAINDQSNVVVSFSAGAGSSGTYRVFVDSAGGADGVYDVGEREVVSVVSMPNGVSLNSAAFDGNLNSGVATRFNPMGIPAGFDGIVELRDSDLAVGFRRVVVSAAGNIKMERSVDGNIWSD